MHKNWGQLRGPRYRISQAGRAPGPPRSLGPTPPARSAGGSSALALTPSTKPERGRGVEGFLTPTPAPPPLPKQPPSWRSHHATSPHPAAEEALGRSESAGWEERGQPPHTHLFTPKLPRQSQAPPPPRLAGPRGPPEICAGPRLSLGAQGWVPAAHLSRRRPDEAVRWGRADPGQPECRTPRPREGWADACNAATVPVSRSRSSSCLPRRTVSHGVSVLPGAGIKASS